MIQQVIQWYKSGLKFDMDFNLNTNERMYCSEMVGKAFKLAAGNRDSISPLTINGFSFLPIERIFRKEGTREILRLEY
jgi:hypothetical protein